MANKRNLLGKGLKEAFTRISRSYYVCFQLNENNKKLKLLIKRDTKGLENEREISVRKNIASAEDLFLLRLAGRVFQAVRFDHDYDKSPPKNSEFEYFARRLVKGKTYVFGCVLDIPVLAWTHTEGDARILSVAFYEDTKAFIKVEEKFTGIIEAFSHFELLKNFRVTELA